MTFKKGQKAWNKIRIPKEFLHQRYEIELKSSNEIGRELNVSGFTILNKLKEYGIPIRSLSEANKGKKAWNKINISKDLLYQKYITERKDSPLVAKELKVGITTINRYLHKYKIPIRTSSEAHKGNIPWNKDLTKETDERLAKMSILSKKNILERMNENPNKYKKIFSEAGKKAHNDHPNLGKENYKLMINQFTDEELFLQRSKAGKIRQEKYPNLSKETGLKLGYRGGKRVHELYPNLSKENSLKVTKEQRNKSKYIWEGVHFDSKKELEVAKLLLDKPIEGINTQFVVNYLTIDFFPKQKIFVEYHPLNKKDRRGLTLKEYYDWRRKRIDETEYKNIPLYIISETYGTKKFFEQIKEIKKIIE